MIWIGVGAFFLFWLIGIVANVLAWWTKKKRLDVLTFLYLPVWSLVLLGGIMIGLLISIFELSGGRVARWRDTWGAKIAIGFIGAFFGTWLGSLISGVVLRWFFKWEDGPTPLPPKAPPVLPADPKP